MTKQELRMILKIIDLHTKEVQYQYYPSVKQIDSMGIEKLKKDIQDLFEDKDGEQRQPLIDSLIQ